MTEPAAERPEPALRALAKQARAGGAERYHTRAREQGKLFVRERLARLLDSAEELVEDGLLANALAGDLPADGVVTGIGTRSPNRACAASPSEVRNCGFASVRVFVSVLSSR